MKTQVLWDDPMSQYLVSRKAMEVNSKRSITTELKKKAVTDKSDKPGKNLIWLPIDTAPLTSGLVSDEPTQLASHIHRMIKTGLGIDRIDEGLGADNLPPLKEVMGTASETSKMGEVV